MPRFTTFRVLLTSMFCLLCQIDRRSHRKFSNHRFDGFSLPIILCIPYEFISTTRAWLVDYCDPDLQHPAVCLVVRLCPMNLVSKCAVSEAMNQNQSETHFLKSSVCCFGGYRTVCFVAFSAEWVRVSDLQSSDRCLTRSKSLSGSFPLLHQRSVPILESLLCYRVL